MINLDIVLDILNAHYNSDNFGELTLLFIKYYEQGSSEQKVILMEELFMHWYNADLVMDLQSYLCKTR